VPDDEMNRRKFFVMLSKKSLKNGENKMNFLSFEASTKVLKLLTIRSKSHHFKILH
jgi:hypothetical protein